MKGKKRAKRFQLEPCPHCGKGDALEILTAEEVNECDVCSTDDSYAVFCSVLSQGCGASGGFSGSPEEAADIWNRRHLKGSVDDEAVLVMLRDLLKIQRERIEVMSTVCSDCYTDGDRKGKKEYIGEISGLVTRLEKEIACG